MESTDTQSRRPSLLAAMDIPAASQPRDASSLSDNWRNRLREVWPRTLPPWLASVFGAVALLAGMLMWQLGGAPAAPETPLSNANHTPKLPLPEKSVTNESKTILTSAPASQSSAAATIIYSASTTDDGRATTPPPGSVGHRNTQPPVTRVLAPVTDSNPHNKAEQNPQPKVPKIGISGQIQTNSDRHPQNIKTPMADADVAILATLISYIEQPNADTTAQTPATNHVAIHRKQ